MAIIVGPTLWQESASIYYRPLGSATGGGFLICKSGGVGWIVASAATEVSRCWDLRNDAVTTAQASAACGDWFLPCLQLLQNPGFCCRTYWDSYSLTNYWSNTPRAGAYGRAVAFGNCGNNAYIGISATLCVRAFRCITY